MDPTLGRACSLDEQCNDGLGCTDDFCDPQLGLCRFSTVGARCQDQVYCNGEERCVPGVGCRSGEPITCSDGSTCTIDRCVEETRSCEHRPRDADGDGDPVWNCSGGTDCDDEDPRIHGGALEVCDNLRDDDCDQAVDEVDCGSPANDSCADPLVVMASGTYPVSLASAAEDLALSCADAGAMRRDGVVALVVPEGPPLDIDVTAVAEDSGLALEAWTDCADPGSSLGCTLGVSRPGGVGQVARLILRQVRPGAVALAVSGEGDSEVSLSVLYGAAAPRPQNETCATADPLPESRNVMISLASSRDSLETACGQPVGNVVYQFDLLTPRDVLISAAPIDDRGTPTISLRDSRCDPLAAELTCRSGTPAVLFARALPPGTYTVAVGALGPSDLNLFFESFEPTEAQSGEGCLAPPAIENGRTQSLQLVGRADAVASSCLAGAPDASFRLALQETSDVLLVEQVSPRDTGAVSLLGRDCDPKSARVCESAPGQMVRARAHRVEAGEYVVVAESALGGPITLTAMLRPPARPTLVGLSDSCEEALRIEPSGGRFLGNTSNARADFEASCDYVGAGPGGARDQMLLLELSETRRVVLDMQESEFETLLTVREADSCPGPEVAGACALGRGSGRSFLDLTLKAGNYWIQIDGFAGASGAWVLDVYTAPL